MGSDNLLKIRAHRITREGMEQALLVNDPIAVHEQDAGGESRVLYYGETNGGRIDRNGMIRVVTVVTSYDLSAKQRRTYHKLREGEWIQ